jgi:hypothetical protein
MYFLVYLEDISVLFSLNIKWHGNYVSFRLQKSCVQNAVLYLRVILVHKVALENDGNKILKEIQSTVTRSSN